MPVDQAFVLMYESTGLESSRRLTRRIGTAQILTAQIRKLLYNQSTYVCAEAILTLCVDTGEVDYPDCLLAR